MQGSIVNRIVEKRYPQKPEVGQYATSYLYSDRNVHYIVKVEKDGEIFWTKDVQRCFKRPEFTATFRTDDQGRERITVKGINMFSKTNDIHTYVDDKLYLKDQVDKEFWLYLYYEEDINLDRWVLLKDGSYHKSRFDYSTGKYRNSIKNTTAAPNVYDYYYDPSF